MTNEQLTKWGRRYGLTLANVKALRRLIDRYADVQTHACNGDPHPSVRDREDKNANSEAWSADSDRIGAELSDLAISLGFTRVDFGVGLYPVLEKDGDNCIMVPGKDAN